MPDKKSGLRRGAEAATMSSFAVAIMGLAKGIVGVLSGSIALLAQAVDSLTDIFASTTVYLGLKFAQKEPTRKFPYGYYRAETFASLVVASLILASGIAVLRELIIRFLHPRGVSHPYIALAVASVSIPFLHVLARFNKDVGEEVNSQAIIGQAQNFELDVYSSILVFVGVASSYLGIFWVEIVVGLFVNIFILKAGAEIGRDSVLALMDAVVTPEHIGRIRRLAEDVQGVIGVHDVKIRKSGPFCFGEMHMEVEEGLSVERAHEISEKVERKAKEQCKELEALTIHMEPAKREVQSCCPNRRR